jgi:DNA topoisomerase-1
MDYNFTANVEKEFDSIAEGELNWTKVIDVFYKSFHPIVEAATSLRSEHKVGERELGIDPKSGKPVFVKIGRYGPVVQIGKANAEDKSDKPKFAALLKSQSIETISLEEALKLFNLPRIVGDYEDKEMVAGLGRFGPYIRHDNVFVSIPKTLDAMTITPEEAIELIEEKRKKDSERNIRQIGDDIEILKGRFGPYIACNGVNYRLPKSIDPLTVTEEECRKIIAAAGNRPASAAKKRFASKKK